MAKILDGNLVSKKIKQKITNQVQQLYKKYNKKPHLGVILVGENEASKTYVYYKERDCQEVGFNFSLIKLSETISEIELLKVMEKLNSQEELDGYIVQLPLPKQINQEKIIMTIDPKKDVDGFHPQNFGKMALEINTFFPATPYGIISLLRYYQISTHGKHCVIIGRSNIVGKPMSILMGRKNCSWGGATVTLTHSDTYNIKNYTQQADIIIAAIGVPNFLNSSMIKEGVIIIDVGITQIKNQNNKKKYCLVGDVNFIEVAKKASWITPVPGGVGPMTRAMLLKNVFLAFTKKIGAII